MYRSNSAFHSSASRGHRLPCGRQSVIERPERVSRVMPPTTTIAKTEPLVPMSHQPTARDTAGAATAEAIAALDDEEAAAAARLPAASAARA